LDDAVARDARSEEPRSVDPRRRLALAGGVVATSLVAAALMYLLWPSDGSVPRHGENQQSPLSSRSISPAPEVVTDPAAVRPTPASKLAIVTVTSTAIALTATAAALAPTPTTSTATLSPPSVRTEVANAEPMAITSGAVDRVNLLEPTREAVVRRPSFAHPRAKDEVSEASLEGRVEWRVDEGGEPRAMCIRPGADGSEEYFDVRYADAERAEQRGAAVRFRPRTLRCEPRFVDASTGEAIPSDRVEIEAHGHLLFDARARRLLLPSPALVPALESVSVNAVSRGYRPEPLSLRALGGRAGAAPVTLRRSHTNIVIVIPDAPSLERVATQGDLDLLGPFVQELLVRLTRRATALGYDRIDVLVFKENELVEVAADALPALPTSFLSAEKPESVLCAGSRADGYSIYDDPQHRARFGPHTVVVALMADFLAPRDGCLDASKRSIGHLHVVKLATRDPDNSAAASYCRENSDAVTSVRLERTSLGVSAERVAGDVEGLLRPGKRR